MCNWCEVITRRYAAARPPPGQASAVLAWHGLARTYTPPEGGESNHWIMHMNSDDLSLGAYLIPASGTIDQEPHTEDEVSVVQASRATRLLTARRGMPRRVGAARGQPG